MSLRETVIAVVFYIVGVTCSLIIFSPQKQQVAGVQTGPQPTSDCKNTYDDTIKTRLYNNQKAIHIVIDGCRSLYESTLSDLQNSNTQTVVFTTSVDCTTPCTRKTVHVVTNDSILFEETADNLTADVVMVEGKNALSITETTPSDSSKLKTIYIWNNSSQQFVSYDKQFVR